MDKKQKVSWGVSFGSLALVAGMVSYLGLSNGTNLNNQVANNQGQQPSNNTNQQQQDGVQQQPNQQSGQTSGNSWAGDSSDNASQFNQNQQAPNSSIENGGQDFSTGDQQQDQFSNGNTPAFGHHHGFDTTTGGT